MGQFDLRLIVCVFFAVIALLHFCDAQTAVAQPLQTGVPPWGQVSGDPYAMPAPTKTSLIPGIPGTNASTPTPTIGTQFFGGAFLASSPSYPPPTQLNAPIVAAPIATASTVQTGSPGLFGDTIMPSRMQNRGPMFPGFRSRIDSRLYFQTDLMFYNVTGMNSPAMVTTSPNGTAREIAGVLGEPGTSVLFGGNELNGSSTEGILFRSGYVIAPQRNFALELELYKLSSKSDGYAVSGDGSVIYARPYFDISGGQESAQLFSYPELVSGGIDISAKSEFQSFLFNGRVELCPPSIDCCNQCQEPDRTHVIFGYRNLRLRDTFNVNEGLVSELTEAPGTISLNDYFRTTNEFHGLQLGVVHRSILNRAWLEWSARIAMGTNEQTLRIDGSTTFNESGVVDTLPGGFYAQRTNMGTHERNDFTMIPEVGLKMGVKLTRRWHATLGYSVLYFPGVLRATEQIDTDINPNLFPEEPVPFEGPLRPRLLWIESDYIAHGLHLGSEFYF